MITFQFAATSYSCETGVTRSAASYGATIVLELADVLLEGLAAAGPVDEDPAVPLAHLDRLQARGTACRSSALAVPGRPDQASVEPVGPRVVRADDRLGLLAIPPHGSSSWPRCRQAFSKPRSTPSRVAGQQHAVRADATPRSSRPTRRRWPGRRTASPRRSARAPRPAPLRRGTQPRGSIRLEPNGARASATWSASTGAGGTSPVTSIGRPPFV